MCGNLSRRWVSDRDSRQRDQYAGLLAFVAVIGLVPSLIWLVLTQVGGTLSAIGLGCLIVFGSAATGAALGFLFSIPRVLTSGSVPAGPGGEAVAVEKRLLGSNTNMERISEWLTTMIVGVGLSQIGNIGGFLSRFSQFVALSNSPTLVIAGPFLLTIGFVGGFIAMYLYTRLYLSPLFLYVEKMIGERTVGAGAVPVDQEEIRAVAKEMADKSGGSVMRFIAGVDEISLDQTMHVLSGLLYHPDGYQRVLKIGKDLKGTPAEQMGRYWFLMAAASGQKHHALLEQGSPAEIADARKAVLEATGRATQLDPVNKRRLLALTDANANDNDLQDFAGDPEFLKLVK